MDTMNDEIVKSEEVRSITPKEFSNILNAADKNTSDGNIMIMITILPDPYVNGVGYKKVIPNVIRTAMNNSMNPIEIEGIINPAADTTRFSGPKVYTYLHKSHKGEYFFRFLPQDARIRSDIKGLNIYLNSVSEMQVVISKDFTVAPIKVENQNEVVTESINNKFLTFLESLKRSDEDVALIESIKLGYRACLGI